jgi:hypothetical protein
MGGSPSRRRFASAWSRVAEHSEHAHSPRRGSEIAIAFRRRIFSRAFFKTRGLWQAGVQIALPGRIARIPSCHRFRRAASSEHRQIAQRQDVIAGIVQHPES